MSELVRYSSGGAIEGWRNPEEHLAEAQQAAAALGRVIAMKPKPVIFNGEQYLELEDWQTVGRFYGYTAKVESTNRVDYDGVSGWEATAVVIDKNGNEVGRAESMCMTDEENWGDVPQYSWEDELDKDGKKIWDASARKGKGGYKAKRIEIARKAKPTFQLRSMAQTRACAKAFRQVLSWVVVLGGFRPNVAEEMIESQLPEKVQDAPQAGPEPDLKRKSERTTETQSTQAPPAQDGGMDEKELSWKESTDHNEAKHISYKQGKLLFVVMSKSGVNDEAMHAVLENQFKVMHYNNILRADFNKILDIVDPDMEHHKPLGK